VDADEQKRRERLQAAKVAGLSLAEVIWNEGENLSYEDIKRLCVDAMIELLEELPRSRTPRAETVPSIPGLGRASTALHRRSVRRPRPLGLHALLRSRPLIPLDCCPSAPAYPWLPR
jgi:hypothetical protein